MPQVCDAYAGLHAVGGRGGPGYSPAFGPERTPLSPRTRMNARLLADTSPADPAGIDGKFSLDELAAVALEADSDAVDDARAALGPHHEETLRPGAQLERALRAEGHAVAEQEHVETHRERLLSLGHGMLA